MNHDIKYHVDIDGISSVNLTKTQFKDGINFYFEVSFKGKKSF